MSGAFLDANAGVDLPDDKGKTPLHWCAHRGVEEAAAVLLEAGADVTATTADEETALGVAHSQGHEAVAALLQQWIGDHVRARLLLLCWSSEETANGFTCAISDDLLFATSSYIGAF